MSFSRYSKYKCSGEPWLGEVPEHWEIKRVGTLFTERREKVSDTDYPPLSVTKNGIVPQLESAAKTQDGDNRKKVLMGDFVINSRSDRKGSSGLSSMDGSVSLISTIMTPNGFNGDFAHYLFRSVPFQEEYYRNGKGIVADLWSTNSSDFRNIKIIAPTANEQAVIVRFLNLETAKIDNLIAKQTKLIELLKEKRQAVISNAVTGGLNPSAPMKDSGVDWLGEVPGSWRIGRIKHLLNIQNGSDHKAIETDAGVPVFGSGGQFAFASRSMFDGESVLLGRKGTVDKPMYLNQSFWAVDTVYWSKIKANTDGRFAYYLATTIPFGYYSTNTALPSMTKTDLGNHVIAIPPIDEQYSIAKHLDDQTNKFDSLTSKAKNAIDLLIERRSAIISAAVTGQIDVRGAA